MLNRKDLIPFSEKKENHEYEFFISASYALKLFF